MRSQSRARKIRRRNSPGRANSRRGRNEQTHRGSSSEDREQKDLRTSGSNGSVPFQIGPVTAMIIYLSLRDFPTLRRSDVRAQTRGGSTLETVVARPEPHKARTNSRLSHPRAAAMRLDSLLFP